VKLKQNDSWSEAEVSTFASVVAGALSTRGDKSRLATLISVDPSAISRLLTQGVAPGPHAQSRADALLPGWKTNAHEATELLRKRLSEMAADSCGVAAARSAMAKRKAFDYWQRMLPKDRLDFLMSDEVIDLLRKVIREEVRSMVGGVS
jgi:hypothetical protein